MIDAAREAIAFTAGKRRADLDADRKLVLAVVKCLEIIGEAAARLSEEVQDSLSEVPWPDIVGMRNRLIHGYFDIDYDIVWATVQDELPALVQRLETALRDEE
jgi:uncharacterized protein with HEPN domain